MSLRLSAREGLWSSRVSARQSLLHRPPRPPPTEPFVAMAASGVQTSSKKRKHAEFEEGSLDGQLTVKVSDEASSAVGPVLGEQCSTSHPHFLLQIE